MDTREGEVSLPLGQRRIVEGLDFDLACRTLLFVLLLFPLALGPAPIQRSQVSMRGGKGREERGERRGEERRGEERRGEERSPPDGDGVMVGLPSNASVEVDATGQQRLVVDAELDLAMNLGVYALGGIEREPPHHLPVPR